MATLGDLGATALQASRLLNEVAHEKRDITAAFTRKVRELEADLINCQEQLKGSEVAVAACSEDPDQKAKLQALLAEAQANVFAAQERYENECATFWTGVNDSAAIVEVTGAANPCRVINWTGTFSTTSARTPPLRTSQPASGLAPVSAPVSAPAAPRSQKASALGLAPKSAPAAPSLPRASLQNLTPRAPIKMRTFLSPPKPSVSLWFPCFDKCFDELLMLSRGGSAITFVDTSNIDKQLGGSFDLFMGAINDHYSGNGDKDAFDTLDEYVRGKMQDNAYTITGPLTTGDSDPSICYIYGALYSDLDVFMEYRQNRLDSEQEFEKIYYMPWPAMTAGGVAVKERIPEVLDLLNRTIYTGKSCYEQPVASASSASGLLARFQALQRGMSPLPSTLPKPPLATSTGFGLLATPTLPASVKPASQSASSDDAAVQGILDSASDLADLEAVLRAEERKAAQSPSRLQPKKAAPRRRKQPVSAGFESYLQAVSPRKIKENKQGKERKRTTARRLYDQFTEEKKQRYRMQPTPLVVTNRLADIMTGVDMEAVKNLLGSANDVPGYNSLQTFRVGAQSGVTSVQIWPDTVKNASKLQSEKSVNHTARVLYAHYGGPGTTVAYFTAKGKGQERQLSSTVKGKGANVKFANGQTPKNAVSCKNVLIPLTVIVRKRLTVDAISLGAASPKTGEKYRVVDHVPLEADSSLRQELLQGLHGKFTRQQLLDKYSLSPDDWYRHFIATFSKPAAKLGTGSFITSSVDASSPARPAARSTPRRSVRLSAKASGTSLSDDLDFTTSAEASASDIAEEFSSDPGSVSLSEQNRISDIVSQDWSHTNRL